MNRVEILEYIIKHGICPHSVCSICPLAKLKKRPKTNTYLSCYSVCITETPHLSVDDAYRNKARQVLVNIMIELALGGAYEDE
jgi:hypothetical protein